MATPVAAGTASPGMAFELTTPGAQLALPAGAVQQSTSVRLEEGITTPGLPRESRLQLAWRIAADDDPPIETPGRPLPPPFPFAATGTLRLSTAATGGSGPAAGTLQVRQFGTRRGLWAELPAAFDVDLRTWLNFSEQATGKAVHAWGNVAGTVSVTNRADDGRGLLQRQTVAHLLQLTVPGQFQAGDWASAATPATTFTYDALRRPLQRVQPDGATNARWQYSGWSTTLLDENNHQRVRTLDALGRLASVQDFRGTFPSAMLFQTTSYAYDVADMLTLVTDATGQNRTTIGSDALGRTTTLSDPDLGAWSYLYHPIGTLASRTDPKGQTLSYGYDALDRPTSKSGPGLAVTYGYDAVTNGVGRRTSLADGAGTASYGYDARGRLVTLVRVILGRSYQLSLGYDEQDRVTSMTYPNGEVLATRYGDHGRPTDLLLNARTWLVRGATYTALGAPAVTPLGNGLQTVYHYYGIDTAPPQPKQWYGRLAAILTGGAQYQQLTSYDGVGNPTALVYQDHAGESFACSYNEWDQLTAFGAAEGYGYLPSGQSFDIDTLQSKGSAGYGYPSPGQARPHAPTTVAPAGGPYSYDQNGNRASNATYFYRYDAENRLTELVDLGLAQLQNSYDGDGVRVLRVTQGGTTHSVGDCYEYDPTAQAATVYYPFNGQAVAMQRGGVLSYLHHDHLGSTVSITNSSGGEG